MALEVAAAVVGLLAAAGKVGETLTPVVVSFTTAPQQIHSLCTEVSNTRLILFGLQRLFEELDDTSSYRKRFIQVQQLIAVLTDGVLLFGELEKLAYYLKSQPSTVYSRIQWIRKGKLVEGLLRRLLIFKTTMQLMLNIVQWYVTTNRHLQRFELTSDTSESDEDARHDRQALVSITADLLKNNLDLGRRVADLEHSSDDDCSTRWSFSIHSTGTVLHRMEDVRINRSERISQSRFTRTNMFQFDADLQASHVYRKVMRDTVDYSFRSSIGLSHAWTTLSKLTLSDISHLSVVGLPLYPNEVSNAYHYKTWSTTDDQSTSERQCLYTELLSNDPTDVVNDPTTTDLRSLDVRKPEHTDLVASNDEENQRCQRMYIVIIPGREEVESKTRLEDVCSQPQLSTL